MVKKFCIVPMCTNSSVKTPEKLFFNVPKKAEIRKKWLKAVKRADPLRALSHVHCCEDHFDIETDMENYVKYKLVGGKLFLKKGVVPHKFACQKHEPEEPESIAVKKRKRLELINKLLNEDTPSTPQCDIEQIYIVADSLQNIENNSNIVKIETQQANSCDSSSVSSTIIEANADYSVGISNASDSEDIENETTVFKNYMQKATLLCISREPQLLLGLPKQCYFTIDLLSEYGKCTHRDVMITLKKIRLYYSNALLAMDFGLESSLIEIIFRKTVSIIASYLKTLIFFPNSKDIILNLPMVFRKKYSAVQSIIDFLEVQIEKPENALHQELTWSEYKRCYTIKYLISITPDGLINYISEGYGGRTSDSFVFEDCEVLEILPKSAVVLADRSFKNISHLLQKKGCTLIRPSSVSSNVTPTRSEVLIHVERSIGRLRHFGFLMPHACVDHNQVNLLDSIIVIACGLVNLHNPLDLTYDGDI